MSNYLTSTISRVLTLLVFLCCFQQVKAQYVTIPDPAFAAYLDATYPGLMAGDQMDTTYVELIVYSLEIDSLGISDLTGIEYMTNLYFLQCRGNSIATLDLHMLHYLETVDCSYNVLTSLDLSTTPVTQLNCSHNDLTSLNLTSLTPSTSQGLNIDCSFNQLMSFYVEVEDDSYNQLVTIDCSHNNLTTLDFEGLFVAELNCSYNQMSVLGLNEEFSMPINVDCSHNNFTTLDLPGPSFQILDCSYNQLVSLEADVENDGTVDCSHNQLTNLPFQILLELNCSYNELDSLVVEYMDAIDCSFNNLVYIGGVHYQNLNCSHNQLTSFSFVNTFGYNCVLNCSDNQISTLPDDENLISLNCNNNLLTSLPEFNSAILTELFCADNQLTILPELTDQLLMLDCSNNQIACFPGFHESMIFLDISGNPNTCVPNYVSAMTTFPSLCSDDPAINPNGCSSYGNIVGNVWLDRNDNCAQESWSDTIVYDFLMRLYDESDNLVGLSQYNGIYPQVVEIPSTYRLELDTVFGPFDIVCDSPGNDSLVSLSDTNRLAIVDFLVTCKSGFDVGCFGADITGWVFPGEEHYLDAVVADVNGGFYQSCPVYDSTVTVVLEVSGPVIYEGPAVGALTPSSVSGSTLTFNGVHVWDDFASVYLTDTTAQSGDSVCVHVIVTPNSTEDYNPANNEFYFCYSVNNSYDPNHKDVYPATVSPGYDDYLTYTVRFQNTGNAPAFNIRLADTMDANLDLETFEVLNYSHPVNVNIMNGIASFRFNDIMLPDSTSNPEGSIGHIQYRVKPKADLPVGTHIDNTAYIFFDFNEPIITNTAVTNFVETWGIAEAKADGVQVYPNPGKGEFIIRSTENNQQISVEAYDLLGNRLTTVKGIGTTKIHLEDQPTGIYLLKVFVGDQVSSVRVVKQ